MSAEAWSALLGTDADALAPGADLRSRWEELSSGGSSLGAIDRIAKAHGRELARFVSLQLELARRAKARFPDGRLTFFTAKGLEQASGAAAADERAARFRLGAPPGAMVWDACCGIGSDAVALSRAGLTVLATDLDPESARCAAGNLRLGSPPTAAPAISGIADAGSAPPMAADRAPQLALFDPDRRRDGARSLRPEDWSPTLAMSLAQLDRMDGGCIKLAPGLDVVALAVEHRPDSELSWVSVDGEMKEINLWTGILGAGHTGRHSKRRAVRLTRGGERCEHSGPTGFADEIPDRLPKDGDWLVELDVALWQSDLAPPFAAERGLHALEPGLRGGFLVADSRPASHGMVRAWRIAAQCPADPKRVRAVLRKPRDGDGTESGQLSPNGPLIVKTRGIREPAEALAARYGGKPKAGRPARLLAVTPIHGNRTALLLEADQSEPSGSQSAQNPR